MPTRELEVMRFTSWWLENNQKRFMRIAYLMSQEEFEIHIDHDDNIYRIKELKIKNSGNLTASCFDLHLKATLDIFGRYTTLMQCDSATRLWLESNAKRLISIRAALHAKLSKFERVPSLPVLEKTPFVEMHLRSLMKQVAALKNKFALYRPSLADKYSL